MYRHRWLVKEDLGEEMMLECVATPPSQLIDESFTPMLLLHYEMDTVAAKKAYFFF